MLPITFTLTKDIIEIGFSTEYISPTERNIQEALSMVEECKDQFYEWAEEFIDYSLDDKDIKEVFEM